MAAAVVGLGTVNRRNRVFQMEKISGKAKAETF